MKNGCGNFLRIDTTDYAGNYGYLKPETYVKSNNTNWAVLRIGSNYGGNSNISLGAEAIDAINIYRGVVGIGGTFTGDTLYQQQKDGISLAVSGNMTVNGNLVSVDGHTHSQYITSSGSITGNAATATNSTNSYYLLTQKEGDTSFYPNYKGYQAISSKIIDKITKKLEK